MRILFDSKNLLHKDPFGCVTPGQPCRLCIHIPADVAATEVLCIFVKEDGTPFRDFPLCQTQIQGAYTFWEGTLQLDAPGLFFYYFRITGRTGSFRLFKQGRDTNMEAGDLWQLSCIPADFTTPDWARGATIYQVFPDRFSKSGDCDLTGKLTPYTIHENWDEEVQWQPTADGLVLNNDFYGGNFRGIMEKLPYIASLGTTIIYLNPIFRSNSIHKYDTIDYYQIDPSFGTEEDLIALVDRAHALGIRVILDGVFNHSSVDFFAFQDLMKNEEKSGSKSSISSGPFDVTHRTLLLNSITAIFNLASPLLLASVANASVNSSIAWFKALMLVPVILPDVSNT